MPRRGVFISYNFRDKELVHSIKSFFQPDGGKCHGKPIFVENNVTHLGKDAIDEEIRRVMDKCVIALFVVGDNSHNSPWINREAEIATSKDFDIVAVQHPHSTGGLPQKLKNRDIPFVQWDQGELSKALNRL